MQFFFFFFLPFLERAGIVYGDCPAILYNDTTYTWSQFAVPISNLLQHGGAKLVFVDIQYASLVNDALSLFPPHLNRPILVLVSDEGCESGVVEMDYDHYFEYEKGDPGFKWIRPESEWDPNYTSGTTSSPKGVVHSHRGAYMVHSHREDGWLYTGDVGVIHPDGYLDRSKDIIICGGENLSSLEVEIVLYAHPEVNGAAVVARPDRYWGETVCAFVNLKEGVAEKF